MGVHGLWRLIEPSGKPVPLETLENKVLAVDISVWLHQAIKGFQDPKGGSLPNAHLLGIFHRLCKLIYFRIKPIFVFDGGVPVLKKQTIAKRNQLKAKNVNEANRIQKQLINTLLKHNAVNKVIVESVKTNLENAKKAADMFELPPSRFETTSSNSDSETETSLDTSASSSPMKTWDLHTIDEKSSHFKNLPADVRHEILTELKETRKQNSWGRIHELPTKSDDFAGYQMKRLLKRYSVQVSLEEAEKEMGGASLSLGELENLLKDHGVINTKDVGSRIASDENKQYFLIKNVRKALEDAKSNEEQIKEIVNDEARMVIEDDNSYDKELEKAIHLSLQDIPSTSKSNPNKFENKTEFSADEQSNKKKTNADEEYEHDLQKAIQLSLQDSSPNCVDNDLFISDSDDSSLQSDNDNSTETFTHKVLASAKNYMTEYSGLTPSEISKIISGDNPKKHNSNYKHPPDIVGKLQKETSEVDDIILEQFNDFKKPQLSKLLTSKTATYSNANVELTKINGDQQNFSGTEFESVEEIMSNNEKPIPNTKNDKSVDETVSSDPKILENEKVESVIDNSDSDSDFVEVGTKTDSGKGENAFEILIQKDAKLNDTDDIFSDIFSDIKEMSTDREMRNGLKRNSVEENEAVVPSQEVNIENRNMTENVAALANKNDTNVKDDNLLLKGSTSSEDNNKLLNEVLSAAHVESAKQLTREELRKIESQLSAEKNELVAKQSLKERLATNITEQMTTEVQELLQLFGVPYIIAPMEAEAQCAFLDEINLSDGTITDDSDIWLFGGRTVYKNFFNQSKRVLEYKAENIQRSFKLSRYEMILLALLVGSDYTTGVQGIGPVTALEVLAHFPFKMQQDLILSPNYLISGLLEFKKWIKGEYNIKGRPSLRRKLKNVSLSDQFPSLQVIHAYLEPSIESSDDNFTWGKPDIVSLMDYAKEKFGWNQKKSEEILKPVFKSLERNNVQNKITHYFETKHKIEGTQANERMSKRIKTAVDKIGKDGTSSDEDTIKKSKETKTKSKRTKPVKLQSLKVEKPTSDQKDQTEASSSLLVDEDIKMLQQTKKVSRKRAKQIENELRYEMEQKELMATNAKREDPKAVFKRRLHSKEVIPQKQKDKSDTLRAKMKAIETFRKSKRGPGYVKKRSRKAHLPTDNAHLSEDSDS